MKQFAVFIDRDGVINFDPGNFHKINELKIFPNVGKAISLLNKAQIPSFVVTNQSVIARGWITEDELHSIHQKIEQHIEKDNAKITKFYYCPHHPEAQVKEYKVICECRKPKIGLFRQASAEFDVDLQSSFVIGDSYREIEAAKNMGGTSIAVTCGRSEFNNSIADYTVADLYEAVQLILKISSGAISVQ